MRDFFAEGGICPRKHVDLHPQIEACKFGEDEFTYLMKKTEGVIK